MINAVYITHPQVIIDRNVAVPQWGLSEIGRERAEALAAKGFFPADAVFIASAETKARQLADILAAPGGQEVVVDAQLGENDRSSTGFLDADAFERAADRFFASPEESIAGWERAIDAQARVVNAVTRHYDIQALASTVVFCGHGAVGSLLKCHLADRNIARSEDQQAGGGNIFTFTLAPKKLLCEWTAIENWMGF